VDPTVTYAEDIVSALTRALKDDRNEETIASEVVNMLKSKDRTLTIHEDDKQQIRKILDDYNEQILSAIVKVVRVVKDSAVPEESVPEISDANGGETSNTTSESESSSPAGSTESQSSNGDNPRSGES
jgi:ethanolamine ammonia-lyase large subunit